MGNNNVSINTTGGEVVVQPKAENKNKSAIVTSNSASSQALSGNANWAKFDEYNFNPASAAQYKEEAKKAGKN